MLCSLWLTGGTHTQQEVCLWVHLNVVGAVRTSVFHPLLEGQMSLQSKIQAKVSSVLLRIMIELIERFQLVHISRSSMDFGYQSNSDAKWLVLMILQSHNVWSTERSETVGYYSSSLWTLL